MSGHEQSTLTDINSVTIRFPRGQPLDVAWREEIAQGQQVAGAARVGGDDGEAHAERLRGGEPEPLTM